MATTRKRNGNGATPRSRAGSFDPRLVLGQAEAVSASAVTIAEIADPLIRVEGVSGATDLGDGRAVLILDTGAIARLARARTAPGAGRAQEIA